MHFPWMLNWEANTVPHKPYPNFQQFSRMAPTDGGQGNFSYADTSVYGQRGFRSQFYDVDFYYNNGILVPYSTPTGRIIVPGPGGGARLPGLRKFGSRAAGFDPHGAVLLRLFR